MGGPRHNGPEGWPEGLPIQASWRLRASDKPQNPLPFVGRFMGYVRLYGELQGGRGKAEKIKGVDHCGQGNILYRDAHPPPKLPSTTSSSGRAEQDLKRQGIRPGRVRSDQKVIGWIPFGSWGPVKVYYY